MEKIDKYIINLSYLYLLIPIMIFIVSWIKPIYSIFFICILIISYIICIKNYNNYEEIKKLNFKTISITLFIVCIWVGLSGIGGFSYQNSDHEFRNAILHDLINFKWPVIYDYSKQVHLYNLPNSKGAFIYYFTYWLPSALVGKYFGWKVANITLYLWTIIGVMLSLYLLFRYLKRYSFAIVVIFIFWSGLDILGNIFIGFHLPKIGSHIEWYAPFQYSSITTTLFWVFNQTVPIWIVLFLILNKSSNKNTIFTYSLCLPYGPFSFIGMALFIIYDLFFRGLDFSKFKYNSKEFVCDLIKNVKEDISFQNTLGSISIIFIFLIFFTSNKNNIGQHGFIWFTGENNTKLFIKYLIFCFVEFGVYVLLIKDKFKKSPYFIISLIYLILIPNYKAGISNDFAMRVSIPSLLIVMIYVIKYILLNTNRTKTYILTFVLIIGAVTPFNEITRSTYNTVFKHTNIIADHWKTFSKIEKFKLKNMNTFVSYDYKDTFFFRYLSK